MRGWCMIWHLEMMLPQLLLGIGPRRTLTCTILILGQPLFPPHLQVVSGIQTPRTATPGMRECAAGTLDDAISDMPAKNAKGNIMESAVFFCPPQATAPNSCSI